MSSEEYELFKEIHASKGMQFVNRMRKHSFSFNIFNGNLFELQKALATIENPDIGIKLMSQDNKQEGDQAYREINRLFHNFLSSAKTLIEHTRIFIDKHYKKTPLQQAYLEKITSEFSQDETCRFIQDLRNFMLHQGLPHSQMTLTITNLKDGQDIDSQISLNVEKLCNWSRWSSSSKRYLNNQGKEIKLSTIVSQYGRKITSLQQWLDKKLQKNHSNDLKELKSLQEKYKVYEQKTNN